MATADAVKDHINYLASDELKGRETGSPQIAKAASYIENQFKVHKVSPYFENYRDDFQSNGDRAFNIVGVVEGTDPELKNELVVIGAHYDHIGTKTAKDGDSIANGANDNASGTTAVLEMAKYFGKKRSNKRSLVFALFSAEEKGLLGSKHMAKRMKESGADIYTVFNIEMIGVPMTTDYLVYLTGYEFSNMAEELNAVADSLVVGSLPKAKEYQLFKRSDNYPFYQEFNIPAHTISTFDFTNFDHYHGVNDEAELMNMDHMAKVINAMIPAIERMSNTPTKVITLYE
ncbi:M20/M25/M40 family metallo-hydrolase [Gangjinia marincola]|uniref:M20/M25/M40 family metallo-hydrolase n=2 Tax=Gangjinia marincola TaxID=578463 RepID=A0ABN1MK51_9FLAO